MLAGGRLTPTSKAARRAIDCVLLVALVATVWRIGGIWSSSDQSAAAPNVADDLPELIQPQTTLAVTNVLWSETPRSVVLIMRTSCSVCQNSVAFYRDIVAEASARGDLRFIVASDEPEAEVREWLDTNSIGSSQVARVPALMSIGIVGTPTLLAVGDDGVVIDVMVGRLSPSQEERFLAKLSSNVATEPMNNLPAPKTIPDEEFRQLSINARVQVLDVRNRAEYGEGHRSGAVNIPFDELETRALLGLSVTAPLFVDCSVGSMLTCRNAALFLTLLQFPQVLMIAP